MNYKIVIPSTQQSVQPAPDAQLLMDQSRARALRAKYSPVGRITVDLSQVHDRPMNWSGKRIPKLVQIVKPKRAKRIRVNASQRVVEENLTGDSPGEEEADIPIQEDSKEEEWWGNPRSSSPDSLSRNRMVIPEAPEAPQKTLREFVRQDRSFGDERDERTCNSCGRGQSRRSSRSRSPRRYADGSQRRLHDRSERSPRRSTHGERRQRSRSPTLTRRLVAQKIST